MRTIKFRGKDESGDWHYGCLVINLHGYYIYEPLYEKYRGEYVKTDRFKEYRVMSETIGQFTCLLDKYGKEIFEGDIVKKTKSGWGGIVLWNSRGYFYIKDSSFYEDEEPDLSPIGSLLCCSRKELEIIGNIHDNKELIKEK